jgi:hypothetical protein
MVYYTSHIHVKIFSVYKEQTGHTETKTTSSFVIYRVTYIDAVLKFENSLLW